MKILCAYSGVEYQVQHLSYSLSAREVVHPVFYIPQKNLITLAYTKWASGELTSTDSYLLFLALLASTERVEFRLPTIKTAMTDAIVASNMENLTSVIAKMNCISAPSFLPPQFVLSTETRTLQNVSNWIAIWESYIQEWNSSYISVSEEQKLLRRTAALDKMLSAVTRNETKLQGSQGEKAFAKTLADWADVAGNFPKDATLVTSSSGGAGTYIPLNEYWKQIIVKCFNAEAIFSIPREDIQELITHCEDNIIHGSSYAYNLMKALRTGMAKQADFLGFGELDLDSSVGYRILSSDSSIEAANLNAMIDSAPTEKPVESNYPSKIAYLRAKVKYELAQQAQQIQQVQESKIGELTL
jgi:hypothetical protein